MHELEVVGRRATCRRRSRCCAASASPRPCRSTTPDAEAVVDEPDLSDVRGHNGLIAALEVAAAGGHNLFLHGPPGTGKTMLARRLPGLLPPLTPHEAIEVTRLHSIAGLRARRRADRAAAVPRAAPHDLRVRAWSAADGQPTPGEATLAHHGVLFLDELSEFTRPALEALRQPLEDGHVTIVRAQRVMVFPTRVTLVAASNPCPCGMGEQACRCSTADLARHQRRLSGPLLDRIDVSVTVAPAVGRGDANADRAALGGAAGEDPRRPRPPDGAAGRHGPDAATRRSARGCCASAARRRRAALRARTSCTTATGCRRAATAASCGSRARSRTWTATRQVQPGPHPPRRLAPPRRPIAGAGGVMRAPAASHSNAVASATGGPA